MPQTSEKAFEAYIEQMLTDGGWLPGTNAEWDKARALFPARVFAFIEATQPKLWAEMAAQHGSNLQAMLLDALGKELDIKGSLHVLRHGFKFHGKLFRLAYFKPAHALSPDVLELYAQNQLTVTRQIPCHPGDHSTTDMVLAVNGLPVATIELKNPGTHQTWRHAVRQYQSDRNPRAPLFDFRKRALVHFAADPDEVWMTTRLAKEKTFFLPFNRGSHPGQIQCGAGKGKEEKAPLSEIIQVLNERLGTTFTDEGRLFFDQIKARATSNTQVIQTAMANPLDKFQLGVRKLIEELMIQRMAENNKIVTRYMDDGEFQRVAFPILAKAIFDKIRGNPKSQ